MTDQGYSVTLEGFIARLDDVAQRLRDADNAGDDLELHDLLDELEQEIARASDYIKTNKQE